LFAGACPQGWRKSNLAPPARGGGAARFLSKIVRRWLAERERVNMGAIRSFQFTDASSPTSSNSEIDVSSTIRL